MKGYNYSKIDNVEAIPVRINLEVIGDIKVFNWFCKRIDELFEEYYIDTEGE